MGTTNVTGAVFAPEGHSSRSRIEVVDDHDDAAFVINDSCPARMYVDRSIFCTAHPGPHDWGSSREGLTQTTPCALLLRRGSLGDGFMVDHLFFTIQHGVARVLHNPTRSCTCSSQSNTELRGAVETRCEHTVILFPGTRRLAHRRTRDTMDVQTNRPHSPAPPFQC